MIWCKYLFGAFMGSKHHFMGFKIKKYEFTFSIWQFAMDWWYLKYTIVYKSYPQNILWLKVWRKVGPHWNKQRALMRQTKSPQWDKQRALTMELDFRTGLFVCLFTNKNQFLGRFLQWGPFVCLTEGSLFV